MNTLKQQQELQMLELFYKLRWNCIFWSRKRNWRALEFEDQTIGIALNLETSNGAVLMGTGRKIKQGSTVRATGKIAQVL
jgi:hypothetical protein